MFFESVTGEAALADALSPWWGSEHVSDLQNVPAVASKDDPPQPSVCEGGISSPILPDISLTRRLC